MNKQTTERLTPDSTCHHLTSKLQRIYIPDRLYTFSWNSPSCNTVLGIVSSAQKVLNKSHIRGTAAAVPDAILNT